MMPTPEWAARGCLLGAAARPCARPVFGAHAVQTYAHVHDVENDVPPRPGVLFLCREHFEALQPPAEAL